MQEITEKREIANRGRVSSLSLFSLEVAAVLLLLMVSYMLLKVHSGFLEEYRNLLRSDTVWVGSSRAHHFSLVHMLHKAAVLAVLANLIHAFVLVRNCRGSRYVTVPLFLLTILMLLAFAVLKG